MPVKCSSHSYQHDNLWKLQFFRWNCKCQINGISHADKCFVSNDALFKKNSRCSSYDLPYNGKSIHLNTLIFNFSKWFFWMDWMKKKNAFKCNNDFHLSVLFHPLWKLWYSNKKVSSFLSWNNQWRVLKCLNFFMMEILIKVYRWLVGKVVGIIIGKYKIFVRELFIFCGSLVR